MTSSEELADNLPPPSITICPIDKKSGMGFRDVFNIGPYQDLKGNLIPQMCEGKEGREIIDCICYDSDSDEFYTDDDSNNSSFDDGEQDSNSEGANDEDETNGILDDLDGGEIEFMFTGNKSGFKFDKDKGNLKSHF